MSTTDEPDETRNSTTDERDVKERAWHEWMMISTGLVALLSIMAMIVSAVALSASGSTKTTVINTPPPSTRAAAVQPAAPAPEAVSIKVKADNEHGRKGPDGQWHDAFLPADFGVRAGSTVTVTLLNYDSGPHTFTAPSLNLNVTIPAGSLAHPKRVTFTFKAPSQAGSYQWWCSVPCDPWAMAHDGYMRGVVTVTA